MTEGELLTYELKVRQAHEIKATINALKDIIDKIEITGRCDNMRFSYSEIAETSSYGIEIGDIFSSIVTVSPEALHISKEEFSEIFSKPIVNYLKEILSAKKKEFENLK